MNKNPKKFKLGDIIRKLNQDTVAGNELPQDTVEVQSATPKTINPAQQMYQIRETELPAQPSPPPPATGSARETVVDKSDQPVPNRYTNTDYSGDAAQAPRIPTFDSSVPDSSDEPEFDFMRYVGILLRRKNIILFITIIIGLISMFGYLSAVKLYSTRARLLFAPGFQDIMGDNTIAWMAFSRADEKFNTHLELLKSNTVLKRVSQELDNRVSSGAIAAGLTISRGDNKGEKNDIIDLAFRHPDPHIAQDVVNQLCKTYIDYIKEVNVQDITRLIINLDDQIVKIQTDLDKKENMLREFKEKNKAVELSSETNITVSKLSQMELDLQKTELDMLENKERFVSLKKEIDQEEINVVQSMTYQNPFQAKLAELELELNGLTAENSPEHYKVKMVKNQIDKIKEAMKIDVEHEAASRTFVKNPIRESLLQELVNLSIEKSSVEARRAAQEQIIKELNSDLQKLPTVELQYAQLTRETESLLQVLKLMKTRYEEAKIKRDSQESDLKILEWAALPTSGISSVQLSRVLLGILIGLVIGVIFAFALEFLDQSIKDPQSAERLLELPLLGIVPMIEMEQAIIENAPAKWKTVLEPFRALRATLKHLAASRQFKTIIICSAVKGEGKTTLAANLAITFSLDGKKVILVDGDMRRAQIHTLFNLDKYNGLSDYLLGARDIDEILKPTVHENLSVITAGEHPQNPAELIGSSRFDHLVTTLRGMADYVIFDSPALLPVSDSLSMAPKIDACIMVVRALWTPAKAALQAKNQLKRIGSSLVGTVLNGISHSRGYYPYYYGYYRYYAYKYTYEDDHDSGPRKKLTLREVGLKVENVLKSTLRQTVFSLPHLTARSIRFARHLAKRKTFWILAALLAFIPIGFAALHYFGIGGNARAISFIGNPAAPESDSSTKLSATSIERISVGSAVQDSTLKSPALYCSLSVDKWAHAFSTGDLQTYLSFYDTLAFRYPSGGFRQWENDAGNMLGSGHISPLLIVNTIHTDSATATFAQLSINAGYITGADTANRFYIMIWQKTNDAWHIIREKMKEQP